jgi:hypothetical protein
VGRRVANTSGSSYVSFSQSQVTARRIDLRGDDKGGVTSALAHEMTHLVLADHFRDAPPPRWADEGTALLADSREKQSRHHRDLLRSIADGRVMRIAELLALDDYPSDQRIAAYYAQSLALTSWLTARGQPHQFVQFLETASSKGYDDALRSHYSIDGVAELESLWRSDVLEASYRF